MAKADIERTFPVSAESFFKAVTQFEKYPEFVEGMQKVRIEQADERLLGHYEFSMMGKQMSYILDLNVSADEKSASWTLVQSDFFKINNGRWEIKEQGPSSCWVRYELEVEFSFPVPGFVLKGLIKSAMPSAVESFFKRAKVYG